MSGSLGFGADAVRDAGIRLISIDRPGLGHSDPDPDKDFTSWTADVGVLINQLELSRPVALGFSQGAPFALALAHGGLVRAAAIVSGQDDLSHESFESVLDVGVKKLRQQIKDDPAGVQRQVTETATAEWLWSMIGQMSGASDRQVYDAEPFATRYRRALEEGFAQGAAGYARDLIIAMSPWPFDPSEIRVPVHLWYGAEDASPVHSPDFGSGMAIRLPRSSRTVIPNEGSAILWLHARKILDVLRA